MAQRPERVLIKNDGATVTCPNCKTSFEAEGHTMQATCPKCGTAMNWGLNK